MAADLAAFQAAQPTAKSLHLSDVLEAIRPATAMGFAWAIKREGADLTVVLMHRGGWDLQSTAAAQGADEADIAQMLLDLLGVPVATKAAAPQPQLLAKGVNLRASAGAAAEPSPPELSDFADDLDDELAPEPEAPPLGAPLNQSDINTCLAMLKALPADARKSFTIAFRSHFQVPREERTISRFITDESHKAFIQSFVNELELQEAVA